ncbi:NCS2 family permease [Leadbettera azotonutricia]|uniref:Inner membrane protein YicO n=1 Tax=Leadbettera azotonutricia (strain ATCC BAA-888 / DSM 13862 / ZAS-9) TaxID=545695 RepID=F5Y966_LEAAZ|nr:NCS2 family permease [Leadbettera azotonutricia]AEF81776.1 inner membrane protein YicO [Leadbettera azotonutricia ZAS-9]
MEKLFKLQEHGTTVRREILAGVTTFLTMAYILAVNPGMLGSIGGGMTPGAVFTATAIASGIATLIMALMANLPVALAPGMGLNAFFTFTVVFGMGYSWQIALTAVFLEGILFVILSLFNVREAIIKAIPANLKKAVAVGIGLFIALIGFANAGIVVNDAGTVIGLGNLTSGSPFLALLGLIIIIVLYSLKIPGSILIGIIATTVIGIPMGITSLPEGFSPFGTPAAPLLFQFDFTTIISFQFFTVFFTFLFVDIFDTVGTLVGVTTQAGLIDKDGNIPHVKQALLADAIGTVAGAALGTSTVTSYVESTAGVAAGGRTGLTALVTGILFFVALILSPLFLLIPSAATAPALIFVGFLMMKPVSSIDFEDPTEGIPAFLAIVMMPFAYSIADGIVYGVLSYVILKTATGKFKDISIVTWILFVIFVLRFVLK